MVRRRRGRVSAPHACACSSRRTTTVPAAMLGADRKRRERHGCYKSERELHYGFHFATYLPSRALSRAEHLAEIHAQVESKAVQRKRHAARVADLQPP